MKGIYEISVRCGNCRHTPGQKVPGGNIPHPKKFPVPKGIEVHDFLKGMKCENCGCEGYMGMN